MEKKVTKKNILIKVNNLLRKLPEKYVTCISVCESHGFANINVGVTKFELKVRIYDASLENWTRAKSVFYFEFEDSDGIINWTEYFKYIKNEIEKLI